MSRNTVVFTNKGEIDALSITSFGVSVKEGDSPIGFFGTGLKYAIAVLLRLKHSVTIISGEKVFQFSLRSEEVRGVQFDFVQMAVDDADPVVLGFTTELGKQWEMWMAYREIACNCKDEGGEADTPNGRIEAKKGVTQVIVTGDEFYIAHCRRNETLIEDMPFRIAGDMEFRNYPGEYFFYRGVRIQQLPRRSLFTYNFAGSMSLTEDRTLKYQFEAEDKVRRAIMESEDAAYVRRCVTAHQDSLEGGMDFHGWSIKPGETFLKVVGECVSMRFNSVNESAVKVWKENTKQKFTPNEVSLTKTQMQSYNKALDFCQGLGFQIRDSFPIVFTDSLGSGTLGLADPDQQAIFISQDVFEFGGTKLLASTLIEEFLHLRHGWADMSREMQNFLFNKVVSLGEELVGEPL